MITDAHAHLTFYDVEDVEAIFQAGKSQNVRRWIMGGYDSDDWQKQVELESRHPTKIITCFGLHPWKVIELNQGQIDKEIEILSQKLAQAGACGETGLDFFKDKDCAAKQEDVFLRHLDLNQSYQKPLVLHVVQAHGRALEILKERTFNGIVHGFSGSYEVAKQYIDLGYKISVGRGIYHKGYKALKDTVKRIDLKHMTIESDVENGEGEKPIKILFKVFEAVAEIKSVDVQDVLRASEQNINEVFE